MLYFKSICVLILGELAKAKETATQLLNLSQKTQNVLYEMDAICILLKISMMFETRNESKKLIALGDGLLNQRLRNKSNENTRRKAAFLYLKATSFDPILNQTEF